MIEEGINQNKRDIMYISNYVCYFMWEEVIKRIRPSVDLGAGPGQSEAHAPIQSLECVMPTVPTGGAVPRMLPRERTVLLTPAGLNSAKFLEPRPREPNICKNTKFREIKSLIMKLNNSEKCLCDFLHKLSWI